MPALGPIAEACAALFTGTTAFLIWRGMQPPKPEIEGAEAETLPDLRMQAVIQIRNPDQRLTLIVEGIKSGRREPPIEVMIDKLGPLYRIRPGDTAGLVYQSRGPTAPKEIICTLRYANRRAKRYKVKV